MATVVFCEDDPTIRKLIRVALRGSSHVVHVAADGAEGLALIERERPDLICTDVVMPTIDGLQLASIVKSRADLAHIPLVFMTASAQRSQIERVQQLGAVDCLIKPFSPAELRAKIEEHLGQPC